jgi:hypothetical protein
MFGGEIVTGPGRGQSQVRRFDGITGDNTATFLAYGDTFFQGLRVAAGDIDGDGIADMVTALGPETGAHVKAFSGADLSILRDFTAYDINFRGGAYVAVGDVNGDKLADIVTAPGADGPPWVRSNVKVYSGGPIGYDLHSFIAYRDIFDSFLETRVATGDVNGDGRDDIITSLGPGGAPHVKVFDLVTGSEIRSFLAYDSAFGGGVYIAGGDINGDGLDDIITGAGQNGSAQVKVFDGSNLSLITTFFAYSDLNAPNAVEVRVGAGDVNNDGREDIITGIGPSDDLGPLVRVYSGTDFTLYREFFAYPGIGSGIFVAGVRAIVPEPSAQFLAGLASIGIILRRRRYSSRRAIQD